MGHHKKKATTPSYATVAQQQPKEKPKNFGLRKGSSTLENAVNSDTEPLISLSLDHSSSDESGSNGTK